MAEDKRIIECVPNFSEGRDMEKINSIADAVKSVSGVSLLNIDPGDATNRTVFTFVGSPDAVCEAAFRSVAQAAKVIDMRKQHGAHPRIGATDVLPLVPVSGITLEECALLARKLAKRVADELRIPCYCYEAAALKPSHRNLATCRIGQYEGLAKRMTDAEQQPDYGARPWDEDLAKTGCSVIGARDFLIAVNFNLNSKSKELATEIARDVREKGRPGKPGTLKCVKAIGWYIDEYGIAQVSMNITNINVTPLHKAFEEVKRAAEARGAHITGTEIIGLIPKRVLLEAGHYYLEKQEATKDAEKQKASPDVSEETLIDVAIKSMGLDDLRPFDPKKKVIEYLYSTNVH